MKNSFNVLVLIQLIVCSILFSISCSNSDSTEENESNKTSILENNNTTLTVISISNWNWVKGNLSWESDSRSRLQGSEFIFNPNGSLTYRFDWDSSVTYNLEGDYYKVKNGEYTYLVSWNYINGSGSGQQIIVSGTIYDNFDGSFSGSFDYASNATYVAIVNEEEFKTQASKRFTANISLTN